MNNNILLNKPNVRFESHQSITTEFPFIIHPRVVRRKATFGIHENLELLYCLGGEGHVLYDGARCPVHKGDIVAVNSYSLHQIVSDRPDQEFPHFCLIIDKNFCHYNGIDPGQLLFQRTIRDDPRATALFRQVMELYDAQDDIFQNAAIKCAVLELLLYLCRHYSTPRTEEQMIRDPALEYVRRAMGFMKVNLSRKLTADEIAASVGLSKFHFLREFKRITGHTLTHYLNSIRCDYARNLLESGQYSVKETAFLCGFTNNSYFSNVFLKYTGMLPSQVQPL